MKTWHWILLALAILASLVLEFTVLADYDSHWWNAVPAFYSIWGFASCMALTFVAKGLGKLFLYQDEKYYDS